MPRKIVWSFAVLGVLSFLLAAFSFLLPSMAYPQHQSNQRNARTTLKTFALAEADFRENDRDLDGRHQYWRKDVAGLYTLRPPRSNEMIELIEQSAAGADLAPLTAAGCSPKAGYWFAALRFEDESELDETRFVFCAVPDTLAAGRVVYAVTHDGLLWEKPAGAARTLPSVFPLNPAKEGWRKED